MTGKKILVTGGNAGIGFALCQQLAVENGCHVFLGSRSEEKGKEAVSNIQSLLKDGEGSVELLTIDVGDDSSVLMAAETLKSKLGSDRLYAIVNNAGLGPQGNNPNEIINVNLHGPKRVIDAFGNSCLIPNGGRIINIGSGAASTYVKNCPPEAQKLLCREPSSWDQIMSWVALSSDGKTGIGSEADSMGGYGLSKALLASYTMLLAKENSSWLVACCTPGFIATKLTAGWGASKTPEEGTFAIRKLLFEPMEGNGWYYGSDGLRSPYHFMRNPGDPVYDGVPPY